MKKMLLLFLLLPYNVQAAGQGELLTRLNEYVDDSTNWKMSQANKIFMLDATARELGRSFIYTQDTTVVTSANTESYAMPSDFAGAIKTAYIRNGTSRSYLVVGDAGVVPTSESPSPGNVQYAYIGQEDKLVLEAIPLLAETLIVTYFAIPSTLSTDTSEWEIPDVYEDAALRIAASKVLMKEWDFQKEREKSQLLYQSGWADIERLKNATPRTVKVEDVTSP